MKKNIRNIRWHDNHTYDQSKENNSTQQQCINSSSKGLPTGWTRATFILKDEHLQKLKAIAYWDRLTLKDVLEEVLISYLETKEVTVIPTKKSRNPYI